VLRKKSPMPGVMISANGDDWGNRATGILHLDQRMVQSLYLLQKRKKKNTQSLAKSRGEVWMVGEGCKRHWEPA